MNTLNNITKNQLNIEFLTCQEVADILKVQVGTIYSWISYEQLPTEIFVKLGRKPRFIKERVFNWILNGAELKKRPKKGKQNEQEV
jgi:excisionase family DNA binding protein